LHMSPLFNFVVLTRCGKLITERELSK